MFRLSEVDNAEILLRNLTDTATGICESAEDVTYSCNLIFTLQGKEIIADIMTNTGHGSPLLTCPRAIEPETWARLDWTFAAPDM